MPILQNAKKALRVAKRKALINQPIRSRLKTMIDSAKKSLELESVSRAFSAIDRAVKGKIIHRNKAARLKSQLSKKLSAHANGTTKVSSSAKITKTKSAASQTAPKAATKSKVVKSKKTTK